MPNVTFDLYATIFTPPAITRKIIENLEAAPYYNDKNC